VTERAACTNGVRWQDVRWAKRSVPTDFHRVQEKSVEDVGTALCAFAHRTLAKHATRATACDDSEFNGLEIGSTVP